MKRFNHAFVYLHRPARCGKNGTPLIILFVLFAFSLKAQVNLVPNPSFEKYIACPIYLGLGTSPDMFETVTDWYSPIHSSPDFYAACSTDSTNGTPLNCMAYQQPRSGGSYMGFIPLSRDPLPSFSQYREYISAKLTQPLVKDSVYLVQFYVSSANLSPAASVGIQVAHVSRYGIYFSSSPIQDIPTYEPIPVVPQVENPPANFLTEEQKWVPVRGNYKAAGGEQWITIGNFYDNNNTPYRLRPNATPNDNRILAYCFIDDVSVRLRGNENTATDTTICSGNRIVFPESLYADSFVWNDGLIAGKRSFNTTGKWWITYYADGQPLVADTLRLFVLPPEGTTKDTGMCNGSSMVLQAGSAASYGWNTGETTSTLTITRTGTYWVKRMVNNCMVIDTFDVRPLSFAALPALNDTSFCKADSARIGHSPVNGYQFTWYPSLQTTPAIVVTGAGQYVLRIDSAGCAVYDTLSVAMHPQPVIGLPPDTVVCFEDLKKIALDAGNFKSYLWQPTGETTRTVYATQAMIYLLTVTDTNFCSSTGKVLVDEECISALFFPNAFTPNSDHQNEVYEVRGGKKHARSFEMEIYNRWGVKVYSSNNVYETWNGTTNNIPQPNDVYVLVARYTLNGKPYEIKMTITLLR